MLEGKEYKNCVASLWPTSLLWVNCHWPQVRFCQANICIILAMPLKLSMIQIDLWAACYNVVGSAIVKKYLIAQRYLDKQQT